MTRHPGWVACVVLAGCASSHRLVAPLAYVPDNFAAVSPGDSLGPPPSVVQELAPRCVDWKRSTLSNGIPLFVAEEHTFPSATVRVVFTTDAEGSGMFASGSAARLELVAGTLLGPDDDAAAQCAPGSCWVAAHLSGGETSDAFGRLASTVIRAPLDDRTNDLRFAAAHDALLRREGTPWRALRRNAEILALGRPSATGAHGERFVDPTKLDVTAARSRLLRPAATSIVVAGDVSVAEVQSSAERAFGGWRVEPAVDRAASTDSESLGPSFSPRVVYVQDSAYAASLAAIIVRGPAANSTEVWPFRIALRILAGGMASEFYARVREELTASYSPGVEVHSFAGASVAMLGGSVDKGTVIAATRAMLAAVRALRDHGPEVDALQRAKAKSKAELSYRASTTWLMALPPEATADEVHPASPCEAAKQVDAVTEDAIRAMMRTYFAEPRLGVVMLADEHRIESWPEDLDLGDVARRNAWGQDLP